MKKVIKLPSSNPRKVYLLKRYPCGHYYANQTIDGKVFYRRWSKLNAKYVKDIFEVTSANFKQVTR
jgi:hypothetical protein